MTDTIFGKDETKSDAQGVKVKPTSGGTWLNVWMFCGIWLNFRQMMEVMVADRDLANVLGFAATILAIWMWRRWSRRRARGGCAGKDPKAAGAWSDGEADQRLGRRSGVLMGKDRRRQR